jgi:hypothetical protein
MFDPDHRVHVLGRQHRQSSCSAGTVIRTVESPLSTHHVNTGRSGEAVLVVDAGLGGCKRHENDSPTIGISSSFAEAANENSNGGSASKKQNSAMCSGGGIGKAAVWSGV